MPEATEQGNHPNPKPAAQAQGGQGSSGNRSGNRGARGGGHRATNRSHNQDHQRHGGNRKPPPGIGGEEHGKGTYHSRSHDGGGSQRHSDGNQTTGRRSEQKGNARHSDGSSSRSSQQSHMRSQSAARHLESDQTSHRGKPPGSAQMGAKFQPSIEQKSPGQRPVDDEKGNSLLPHTNDPSEPRESGPVEPTLTDPCIVEQKELTVEEQQQQAQHIHMQMQQQQFLQLALAQQLYFQQIQQQAVRVAAMMAAQQQLQQEQTETKQGEGERPDYAAVDKHQPIENSTEKQSEGHGEGASSKSQVGTFKPVPFDIVLPMPESGQQMVSDDVSEQELARHLDMFMKEQGLVTGNDVSSRIPDHSVFRQQFVDQANSHVAREADLVHPQYTQELSAFSRTSEGYKIDTPLVSSAAGTSAFSSSGTSRDPLFFTHPAHSSETAASTSHLITTQPPVEDDLLTVSHSYSCTPPLQPTNTAVYNGHSTSSPFDFVHDSPGCTFTGLSDHSSEHSWLGDSEPQLTSLTSESAAFETVGVTVRPVGRVTDSTSQPDTRRQRKGASHKPSPRQVTLEVGGRMFYVYPATFQSYPDSLLNQVLNGSKPVKLNERQAIAFDRDGFIFDILLAFCRTGRLTVPSFVSMAAVLDEAKFFQLDKYLCDPKFANSPRYHLTFKRDRTYRLAMKQEQGCLVNCLFVVRDSDRLIVKEIRESSMRLLVDVKLENGDIKAKDYVLYDPHQPRQVPVLRGGHIYTFRLGLPTDISRGVPIPTMDIIFQELLVFGEHEQLVDISANSDRD